MTSKKRVSATVIADSISEAGARLTTMELHFPRYLLAELNTHRDFSRNSASSRARSVSKTLAEVEADPYVPHTFYREIKGMSGGAPLGEPANEDAQLYWQGAASQAVEYARDLVRLGVHKSQINRLLEPFMWHTAVVTATEWDNFFAQRLAKLDDGRPAADPVFFELAHSMRIELDSSEPEELSTGEWHLPYIRQRDHHYVEDFAEDARDVDAQEVLKRISVARCAGVSYLNQDNTEREIKQDLDLYFRLAGAEPPHWSPFEHVATPTSFADDACFNLRGWTSLRYVLSL